MLRRLASVLVVCLGLLWVSSPAFACAKPATDSDCCPHGVPSPCGGEGSAVDFDTLASLCCASAPAPSSAVSVDASRKTHFQPSDSGSPHPIVAIAWFATLTPVTYPPPLTSADSAVPRTDAALTYLHTRRLRL